MRDINNTEDLFRPEYELNTSLGYAAASAVCILSGGVTIGTISVPLVLSSGLSVQAIRWFMKSLPRIQLKKKLIYNYFLFEPIAEVRKRNIQDKTRVYIGRGFEWGPEHAALYHRVASMSTTLDELRLPKIFTLSTKIKKKKADTETLGGKAWIHGLGEEKPIYLLASAFYGHTFICGLPGTGKTTLLNMLSTGTLNRGSFNLIIDPKPDHDWEQRMREECKMLGMPFHFFSTSHPSKSCRIDPLRDYERVTDIPTRITSVASTGSQVDPYIEFTWGCINQVVQAMIYCSIPAQLSSISYYLRFAGDDLAVIALERFYEDYFGSKDVFQAKKSHMKVEGGRPGDLLGMAAYYNDVVPFDKRVSVVNGIISFATHDKTHVSKMIASTEPLFDKLTSSPLDKLLSPDINEVLDPNSENYILNLEEMLESGGCLYISLNSMADSMIAGAIGKLILSAISSAASRRYSHEGGKGRRVALFVDEAHACLNEKLIDLMAVGRGAAFEIYLSTQTVPDLAAKSDPATAKRILGLASNMFALRVSDDDTQKWVSSNFGSVDVDKISYQRSNCSSTAEGLVDDQAGGFAETFDKAEKDLFPPVALGNLPNLQYIARTQSGMKIKGRIPILTN